MMLLAASLIGISSATYIQPEVATGQPQQQQLQSPSSAPPTLGKRLTGPQGQQQQQSNVVFLLSFSSYPSRPYP
jgi:hypothetical protein